LFLTPPFFLRVEAFFRYGDTAFLVPTTDPVNGAYFTNDWVFAPPYVPYALALGN
tara:strand:+ start:178 stop:342 length:165 start_codon:yes stop_codon:yes gene_type:complete